MKIIQSILFLLVLFSLGACEKSPIEKAGISVSENMPKAQLALVNMIPGEPEVVARSNVEAGMRRLFAYHNKQQMIIPAVTAKATEDYAVSFGVIVVPGMNEAQDENHKKLQQYFLDYAKRYNKQVIDARMNNWKTEQ